MTRHFAREQALIAVFLLRGAALGALVGVGCGATSALFLRTLEAATAAREHFPPLLWGLPLAGLLAAWCYETWGKEAERGSNLLLDRIHDRRAAPLPLVMAPLVLVATVLTHLFGGSAGREGTAVQMGGTIGEAVSGWLCLGRRERRALLQAGISGGFGAVFGTPLAGAVFGLEVLAVGGLNYGALAACVVSSLVGDAVCRALGVHHAVYIAATPPAATPWLAVAGAGVVFAAAAALFIESTDAVKHLLEKYVSAALLRPVAAGAAVIALAYLFRTNDYLGLSLPLLAQSFAPAGVPIYAWLVKILFTAVTLGGGFKGGEVTPLFVVGATLGCAYAHLMHQPPAYFAALGLVSVFAAAANTPLSCVLLAVELFGSAFALPALACVALAYTLSGHRGIYGSQQMLHAKARGVFARKGRKV